MTEALFSQFAALLAAALLIPSFVFLAYGVNHRNMPFWWTAALAYFLIFFGSTVAAIRLFIPDILVSVLANTLIAIGYVLCLRSVRMIKSCWMLSRGDLVVTAVFLLSLILVVAVIDTYPARVALISLFMTVISVGLLWVVVRSSAQASRLGDVALLVFATGNALFATLRGTTALLERKEYVLSFELWDQVFFIWSISAVFCFAIGLFLNGTALISEETNRAFTKERALTEALTEALEGQRNLKKLVLHELKRPLNAVATAVDLSRQGQMGMSAEEVDRVHQMTCVANDYMQGIGEFEDIHELLASPTLTEVNVSSLIEDVRNKWQVTIHASEEAIGASVNIDLLLFDIATGNLIDNGRKFGNTPQNIEVRVQVSTTEVSFDVTDDGPGIPPSEAEKVFRQFYKINSRTTNAIKGCGLGLYVVRRIAEAHGGACRVVSQRPSTLRLTFPTSANSRKSDD
jgi:signal transduction histidine kinase